MHKPYQEPQADRLPPHSDEAEAGVLGCLLLNPEACIFECREKLTEDHFFDVRHRSIYRAIIKCYSDSEGVDILMVHEWLKAHKQLEDSGGMAYLASLPETVPSASNIDFYLEEVVSLYHRRQLISVCTESVNRLYDGGEFDHVFNRVRNQVFEVSRLVESKLGASYGIDELLSMDTQHDPDCLIGNRFLCKKGKLLISANSGAGKSSLLTQMLILWAMGEPFCGIKVVRPLRCIVFGDENDKGDLSEMVQGILTNLGVDTFESEKADLLRKNFVIHHCPAMSGDKFLSFAERKIIEFKADIAAIDPLVSFADVDLSTQIGAAQFLRHGLSRIADTTDVIWAINHHNTKPKEKKGGSGMASEQQYAGAGSYDLAGWARAVWSLVETPEGIFKLMLAKRGKRAGATHPDGTPTSCLWLKHSDNGIFWIQCDEPIEPEPEHEVRQPKERKQNITEKAASANLYEFCRGCKPEGESMNAIAKRLEGSLATMKIDVSATSCKTKVIPLLVENGKLEKRPDGMYVKGPNA